MLKTASIYFLLGLLAVSGVSLLFDSVVRGKAETNGYSWASGEIRVVVGRGLNSADGLLLELNQAGQGVIEVPGKWAKLDELPILHLVLHEDSSAETLLVAWRTADSGSRLLHHRSSVAPAGSLWLPMGDVPNWEGRAATLGLVFLGPPGERVQIQSVEVVAAVFPYNALAVLGEWTDFSTWKQYSINAHWGVNSPEFFSLHPVPAAMAVFIASTASYLLGLVILRGKRQFEWRVVATMFLACWLALDMVWQGRLLHQLDSTRETFAGKTPQEKRQAGLDAELFGFITQVKDEIGPGNPRVFVTSTNDYAGMRGAYYLYPANVYWQRNPQSLPGAGFIFSGDYLVLLQPTDVNYDAPNGILLYGEEDKLPVSRILSTPTGDLYQVL